jgi:hypothetical protein
MSTVDIKIPSEIFERLEKHAKGFDTPANVIERLLNLAEGFSSKDIAKLPERNLVEGKDFTKYIFNNHRYVKCRLVLAVVKEYVSSHPNTSFDKLLTIFPKKIQGSIGVFNRYKDVQKNYAGKNNERHFTKPNELIQLSDCVISVCTQWGPQINDFIKRAESIGYSVYPTNDH